MTVGECSQLGLGSKGPVLGGAGLRKSICLEVTSLACLRTEERSGLVRGLLFAMTVQRPRGLTKVPRLSAGKGEENIILILIFFTDAGSNPVIWIH